MTLKFTVDSLDSVPEAVRSLYTESNGKFTLQVDGAVPKARLDEFRNNNLTLKQQLDEMSARFEGVDPDAFKELSAQAQKLKEKKLIEAGKVDELIEARVQAMKADHDKTLKTLAGERDAAKTQLESLVIDGALRDAAMKSGVRPTAIDDVLLRGRQTFRLDGGKAVAFDGDKPLYGKDSEPLGVSDWVAGLAERAPHLFEANTGGGAPKGGNQGGNAGQKTITRSAWNALDPASKVTAARTMKIVD